MLSRSNDTEITKRDAHQTDDDAFSRIEYIDLHVLSPQKGNKREKKRIGKMRKNETHKPHQSLIRSSSSSKEEEEEEDKNTRQQEEEDNENVTTREEDFFNPTSDGSSQRRTHGTVFGVSRGVRGVCYKKTLDFLPKKQNTNTQIENPKHFFDGFKNHFFFSPKEARYYFLSQKNILL